MVEEELLAQADAVRGVCDLALLNEAQVLADIFSANNMQRLARLRGVCDVVAFSVFSEASKGDPAGAISKSP